jgi:hypothetical protein
MRGQWVAVLATFVTMCVVTLFGVLLWFQPIAQSAKPPGVPLLSPALNLPVYALLSVLLFDWTARRTGSPWAAAFVLGASQYILVIDLTLRGERAIATAGASAVLLVVTWASVAFVHSVVARRGRSGGRPPHGSRAS